jgi:hypothetical protein
MGIPWGQALPIYTDAKNAAKVRTAGLPAAKQVQSKLPRLNRRQDLARRDAVS